MQVGDRVYFVCDSAHLDRAMASFGHGVKAKRGRL